MITVDSSVWIGYFNGDQTERTRALDVLLDDSANELVMLDVVLMEVLRGFRHERDWRLARQALAPLPVAIAGGEQVALGAAQLYRELRRKGITVRSPIDLLVGAWCIHNGCALLHDDTDFDGMERMYGLHAWRPE